MQHSLSRMVGRCARKPHRVGMAVRASEQTTAIRKRTRGALRLTEALRALDARLQCIAYGHACRYEEVVLPSWPVDPTPRHRSEPRTGPTITAAAKAIAGAGRKGT